MKWVAVALLLAVVGCKSDSSNSASAEFPEIERWWK